MRITALVENTSIDESIKSEHGLSLYIETEDKKILFDTGQTDLFFENAKKLGIDLEGVDMLILSHGHYDHGGGMRHFFEINKKAKVYVNRASFGDYYNGTEKYIGLDKELKNSERIVFVDDEMRIEESLSLYSCNEKERINNLGSFGLTEFKDGGFLPDEFLHEQYFLIEEKGKRVLISGCSHKGVMDITNWFKPDVLVGGFHFSKLPLDEKLASYAKYLDSFDTTFYTCHCTGVAHYEFMKKYMNDLNYLSAGQSIII